MQAALSDHLKFLDIDEAAKANVRLGAKILEPHLDEILEAFYARLMKEPAMKIMFTDEHSVERARAAQRSHWADDVLTGTLNTAYLEKVERIGKAHARIGLTPLWYLSGYCHVLEEFVEAVIRDKGVDDKEASEIVRSLLKVVFLDINLVVKSYLAIKNESMRDILRRATRFNSEAEQLCIDIQSSAATLSASLDAS